MDPKDLKSILDALDSADVREFSLKTGEFELSLRRGAEVVVQAAPVVAAAQPAPVPQPAASTSQSAPTPVAAPTPAAEPAHSAVPKAAGTPVKAPIVGTFYASPSPDAAPFVKVGDSVQAGQVLCIIEAMKLMNEIEAETAGTVREILVKNADPVEYGQTLFLIE